VRVLQVFDLGASGEEVARKVAELPDYLQEVTRLSGARQQVFGAGDDKRSTNIKYLAVVREWGCSYHLGQGMRDEQGFGTPTTKTSLIEAALQRGSQLPCIWR